MLSPGLAVPDATVNEPVAAVPPADPPVTEN